MAALAGYGAQILAASGVSTPFTNEALTDAGDHKTYTITNAAHRYWDTAVAVVIQESTDSGATWHAVPSSPTVAPVGGKVTFAVARTSTYQYRAQSGNYFTITTIGAGHQWDVTLVQDLYDVTEFGQTFHAFIAGEAGGTGTIARWWIDAYFWTLLLAGTAHLIVALYTNTATGSRYEGYAFLKQAALKVPIAGVVEDAINFTLDENFYYNPGP